MEVNIRRAKLVVPESKTPNHVLWNSNVDLVIPRIHTSSVYFYKKPLLHDININNDFFNYETLEDALAKALVPFYPMAGRLLPDHPNGRIHIDCNAQGVLLVEAHANVVIDDFGDFTPTHSLKQLIPNVTYTQDISTYPLLLLQVTFFRCGGVSLGVGMEHHVADGMSGIQFINTWANIAKTKEVNANVKVYIDRTLLRAREPPTPKFEHVEYKDPPKLLTETKRQGNLKHEKARKENDEEKKCSNKENLNLGNKENMRGLSKKVASLPEEESDVSRGGNDVACAIFHLSNAQVAKIRTAATDPLTGKTYSTYEAVASHVWRCTSEARGLSDEQDTKLYIATDGRSRLRPTLPEGYFGNVIFTTTPIAKVAELRDATDGASMGAAKIRAALKRMDDEYLRSALDFLELRHPNVEALVRGAHTFRSPNLGITSWMRLPIYDADFGWGRPIFMGPPMIPFEGLAFILPPPPRSPSHVQPPDSTDTALSVVIALSSQHMPTFRHLFYTF